MKAAVACAILLLVATQRGVAQEPEPSNAAPASLAGAPPEATKSPVDADLEPAADGYSYNPSARRDPFISLNRPVSADRSVRQRPAGMEGFLIMEVALKGIVRTAGGGLGVGSFGVGSLGSATLGSATSGTPASPARSGPPGSSASPAPAAGAPLLGMSEPPAKGAGGSLLDAGAWPLSIGAGSMPASTPEGATASRR